MDNWFKPSPTKATVLLSRGKKYEDINACDVCKQKSKWCVLVCKYRKKKWCEIVKERTQR